MEDPKTHTLTFSEALELAKKGARIRHAFWGQDDPDFLVFVPGRDVQVSFEPMLSALGPGAQFRTFDHLDAVYMTKIGSKSNPFVRLNYAPEPEALMTVGWMTV